MADDDADPAWRRRLTRRSMQDGHEVVSGGLAQEALDAVGARAMTLDRSIVVGEGFDPDDPADQALYAHEAHHRDASGGEAPHHGDNDDEEQRARAIEAQVLHRARSGDDAEDDDAGAATAAGADHGPDALAGYRALRARGLDHAAVVRHLARHVVEALRREDEDLRLRGRPR